ncbi:MAG: sodium/solute symporter [Phycisphaerae bacterium]|nr:sodium/solute symporter [Phycisphaerae bacterium]
MTLSFIDIAIFIGFVVMVVAVGMIKSRNEKSGEDYFLAGRGLSWWLIGFSLIAANISSEQFVGMSGNAASHVGLAIASYEWMAAITLVVVAFAFLPYFLRAGIYTMPEFLEVRYNAGARTIMALFMMLIYILLVGAVTYSGALTLTTLAAKMGYNVSLLTGSFVIGLIAMIYVATGGLKACAWADLIQGSALILGGAAIMWFAFDKLGGVKEAAAITNIQTGTVAVQTLEPGTGTLQRFMDLNSVRMNMYLPRNDAVLPWTALLLGLWIPNFYYWGLNQYITQRTLGSASLAQGQRGIVFAAFMKLLIPFVIVIPGIIAFNLFSADMQRESVKDNAPIMARYFKANPQTKCVEVAKAPTAEAVTNWKAGRFMIAVFPNDAAVKELKVVNPYVLPMTEDEFGKITPAKFTVFKSEDKTFKAVNTDLAAEIDAYNAETSKAAKAAGKIVVTEKPIVYKYDTALGQLLGNVLPQGVGIVGFVLAALLGAVVSSLAAMLNAASTIFSMDLYKKFLSPKASSASVVFVGRVVVVVFAAIAIFLAPNLGNPKISNSIFTIIQESQGFISPGILAVFTFGLILRRAPRGVGVLGLLTSIVSYGVLKFTIPSIQFLNRMAISFVLCLLLIIIANILKPMAKPVEFHPNTTIDLTPSRGAVWAGLFVVAITLVFYVIFSPLVIAK